MTTASRCPSCWVTAPTPRLILPLHRGRSILRAALDRRALSYLRAAAALLFALPAAARAQQDPGWVSAEVEITDPSLLQLVGNSPNPECSNMVRVADRLYVAYRVDASRIAAPTGRDAVFVRPVLLDDPGWNTIAPEPTVIVDSLVDPAHNGYHTEPAILRDASGRLLVLNPRQTPTGATDPCFGGFLLPPRRVLLTDPRLPTTWHFGDCLPSRVRNIWSAFGVWARFYDIMGVFDPSSGVTHFVGEGASLNPFEGRATPGAPRVYYRLRDAYDFDGPYILIQPGPNQPAAAAFPGNVFVKGDLVLGREPTGRKSLHLVWNIRNSFYHPTAAPQHFRQWNYNLYYAVSRDGGETWQNADGSASVPLRTRLFWNDARFLAHQGDVMQNSERAFDVDAQSRPVLAMLRHRPGTGLLFSLCDPKGQCVVHVDNNVPLPPAPAQPLRYDLVCLRWTGSEWRKTIVDNVAPAGFYSARPRVRVDLENRFWVFVDASPFGGGRPRYALSDDGGETWRSWYDFGAITRSLLRVYSYADPIDPNFHYLAGAEHPTGRLFLWRLLLTRRMLAPLISPPGGAYPGPVLVSIRTDSPAATLRYTTNGSNPGANSTPYTGPFYLTPPVVLKARAFRPGWTDSPVTTAVFSSPSQTPPPG